MHRLSEIESTGWKGPWVGFGRLPSSATTIRCLQADSEKHVKELTSLKETSIMF